MILWLAVALAAAQAPQLAEAATPAPQPATATDKTPQIEQAGRLAEAAHAIRAGRLDQARLMIAAAVAAGASGDRVDRLLADLAYASGDDEHALPAYLTLLTRSPTDPLLAEHAGIAALRLGKVDQAVALLNRATALPGASWRAWNARAAAADRRHDWPAADAAYARAAALAPDRAEIANNIGWSLLLRGEWESAAAELERAATLDPTSPRIANNLELARAAVAADLPARLPNESDEAWAARLNDAGVAAAVRGDKAKAVSAFAQAIEARSHYYARAANNLALVETRE